MCKTLLPFPNLGKEDTFRESVCTAFLQSLSSELSNETICRVMKYNSEAIHDSFSEFKFCHTVNLRRTGSFIRLTYFQI